MKTFKQIQEEIKQVSVSKEHEDTLNGQKDPTSSGLKIKTDATDAQKSNTLKSRKPASALVVKPTNENKEDRNLMRTMKDVHPKYKDLEWLKLSNKALRVMPS